MVLNIRKGAVINFSILGKWFSISGKGFNINGAMDCISHVLKSWKNIRCYVIYYLNSSTVLCKHVLSFSYIFTKTLPLYHLQTSKHICKNVAHSVHLLHVMQLPQGTFLFVVPNFLDLAFTQVDNFQIDNMCSD